MKRERVFAIVTRRGCKNGFRGNYGAGAVQVYAPRTAATLLDPPNKGRFVSNSSGYRLCTATVCRHTHAYQNKRSGWSVDGNLSSGGSLVGRGRLLRRIRVTSPCVNVRRRSASRGRRTKSGNTLLSAAVKYKNRDKIIPIPTSTLKIQTLSHEYRTRISQVDYAVCTTSSSRIVRVFAKKPCP